MGLILTGWLMEHEYKVNFMVYSMEIIEKITKKIIPKCERSVRVGLLLF